MIAKIKNSIQSFENKIEKIVQKTESKDNEKKIQEKNIRKLEIQYYI